MYVGLNINPLTPITNDLYVRYYIRFMPGWTFGSGSQQLKMNIFNGSHRTFMVLETLTGAPRPAFEDHECAQYGGRQGKCESNGPPIAADGVWRLIEARVFRNGENGRMTMWQDGVLIGDYVLNIGLSTDATTILEFGYSNQAERGYNLGQYLEWEDVVIADHYIGPNGATSPPPPSAPPAPPVNLRVQ
jgi:hypothetical protein